MKKIIAIFVFMLAFSFDASAQEQKTAKELGKEDAYELVSYLELPQNMMETFTNLFEMKHESLLTEGISEERKQVLAEVIKQKIFATVDATDVEKLQENPELLKKLTSE